jgi:transposase
LIATGGVVDRSTKRKTLLWKDNLNKMKVEPLFSLPKGVEVTSIEVTENGLIISAVSTQPSACCPLCSSAATRVHSHYTRTIADLPCAGQHVRLLLQVRKFFCEVSTCTRKIFAERLTPFVERMAHA